jgi:hypothetical protein
MAVLLTTYGLEVHCFACKLTFLFVRPPADDEELYCSGPLAKEKHDPFKENNVDEKPFADCCVF